MEVHVNYYEDRPALAAVLVRRLKESGVLAGVGPEAARDQLCPEAVDALAGPGLRAGARESGGSCNEEGGWGEGNNGAKGDSRTRASSRVKSRLSGGKSVHRQHSKRTLSFTRGKGFSHKSQAEPITWPFGQPLGSLPGRTVILEGCNASVEIPFAVSDLVDWIRTRGVETDGIFRKSTTSQKMASVLETMGKGKKTDEREGAVEVACILKKFFRSMPQSILPKALHEPLRRAVRMDDDMQKQAMHSLLLLMLPKELATLTYLLQLLRQVMENAGNKMDSNSLSRVWWPNLFQDSQLVAEKTKESAEIIIKERTRVVQLMIEEANRVGVVWEELHQQVEDEVRERREAREMAGEALESLGSEQLPPPKKKRRSGSLTRMLTGFLRGKKGHKESSSDWDLSNGAGTSSVILATPAPTSKTPASVCTPHANHPTLKRAASEIANSVSAATMSTKKRRMVLQHLPQAGAVLPGTPFTPGGKHWSTSFHLQAGIMESSDSPAVMDDPSPKDQPVGGKWRHKPKFFSTRHKPDKRLSVSKCGDKKGGKRQKTDSYVGRRLSGESTCLSRSSLSPLLTTSANNMAIPLTQDLSVPPAAFASPCVTNETDIGDAMICLSDEEDGINSHREARNAVSVRETPLTVGGGMPVISYLEGTPGGLSVDSGLVATEEEGEEDEGALLSQGQQSMLAEELRRLQVQDEYCRTVAATDELESGGSRRMKVAGVTVGRKRSRSPCARKIGALRRRSRELVAIGSSQDAGGGRVGGLRRGRPNTVATGLPKPNAPPPCSSSGGSVVVKRRRSSVQETVDRFEKNRPTANTSAPTSMFITPARSNKNKWRSAHEVFLHSSTGGELKCPTTGRPSVAQLAAMNAGKVSEQVRSINKGQLSKGQQLEVMQRRKSSKRKSQLLAEKENRQGVATPQGRPMTGGKGGTPVGSPWSPLKERQAATHNSTGSMENRKGPNLKASLLPTSDVLWTTPLRSVVAQERLYANTTPMRAVGFPSGYSTRMSPYYQDL